MARPMKLERTLVPKDPDLIWNTVIRLISTLKPEELNEVQKVFQLSFRYDVEVQGGGHERYFSNVYAQSQDKSPSYVSETVEALKTLGALEQAEVLNSASAQCFSETRQLPPNKDQIQQSGNYSEFEEFDDRFFQSSPNIDSLLVKYLQAHLNEFVEII